MVIGDKTESVEDERTYLGSPKIDAFKKKKKKKTRLPNVAWRRVRQSRWRTGVGRFKTVREQIGMINSSVGIRYEVGQAGETQTLGRTTLYIKRKIGWKR
jgi:ribosomal protein L32E